MGPRPGHNRGTNSDSENGKPIPCLDTQFWMGTPVGDPWYRGEEAPQANVEIPSDVQVPLFVLFKKQVASKIGTLARSAIPESSKVQTAVNVDGIAIYKEYDEDEEMDFLPLFDNMIVLKCWI